MVFCVGENRESTESGIAKVKTAAEEVLKKSLREVVSVFMDRLEFNTIQVNSKLLMHDQCRDKSQQGMAISLRNLSDHLKAQ